MGIYNYARQLLLQFRELAAASAVQISAFVGDGSDNDANGVERAPGKLQRS